MTVDKTFKEGGSGKGQAVRQGLNLTKFGDNLDKTKGTRKPKCLDCEHFKGINCIDIVNCKLGRKNKKGLDACEDINSSKIEKIINETTIFLN